jgi:sigma-54 dependent transcriptional regulator, acetoin dehydrogenase operon transcriptional activator AcoR
MTASSRDLATPTPAAVDAPPQSAPQQRTELIRQSHRRSAALGLSRGERLEFGPMMRSDLVVARERNQRLCIHAAPVMQVLFEQIVNTESMIVLTDAHGTILHSVGDDDFLERATKVALAPGENWAEHAKGTNAIGTALFEEKPTLVHANEHFIHANSFLTCSAAPIFDPRGNVLGVLDVTGDHRGYHQHTMGLVRMSARMIENHWLSDDYNNRLRLHFHSRPEFIGTLLEGIVAVAPDGKILGGNRSALDQLALSGAALRAQSLTSLFGTSTAALYDYFRMPLATPLRLCLPSGQQFYVSARFDWPSQPVVGGRLGESVGQATVIEAEPVGAPATAGGASTAAAAALAAPEANVTGLKYLCTGDPQIELLVQKLRRIIDRDIPILVLGETGTGKELLARAVHQDSARARQPFVAVNCASIPESLIEAELFGYEDGAFTGARRKGAPGRIVQANGGTLFLDEIGDMPLALQARLLRVLQERSVTPLGSTKTIAVDIAVIGATHRNLREMINRHEFREDLYYRLNGLALRLPPLRERTDLDVVARRIVVGHRPKDPPEISPQVMELFRRYPWPGNIRQLANVLRTAAVMSAGESTITAVHLSDDFLDEARSAPPRAAAAASEHGGSVFASAPVRASGAGLPTDYRTTPSEPPRGYSAPDHFEQPAAPGWVRASDPQAAAPAVTGTPAEAAPARTLEEAETELIRSTLQALGGNISAASKQLGISRNTIYRRLRWNVGKGEAQSAE